MAIYHCSISNISRSKGGSSCATLAYISGENIHDERRGVTYAYSRRERVAATGTLLPDCAPSEYADPAALFNAVEQHETAANARTAKKIEVALPRELTLDEQKKLVEGYIKDCLIKEGYPATYAIHIDKEERNPHCHILVSNRPMDSRGNWTTKSKKTYALDKNGNRIPVMDKSTGMQKERIRKGKGAEKVWKRISVEQNSLDKLEFLKTLRASWADHANAALRDAGHDERIDHRSYKDQGLLLEPTKHVGYKRGKIYNKRQEINDKIFEIDSLYNELYNTEKEQEAAQPRDSRTLMQAVTDIVALTMYRRMEVSPMNEQTRASAARQTASEMDAALEKIGIPAKSRLGFCLRCGYEVQDQLKGRKPQKLTAGTPSPVSFDLAKLAREGADLDLDTARDIVPQAVLNSDSGLGGIYEKLKYINDPEARRRLLAKIEWEQEL